MFATLGASSVATGCVLRQRGRSWPGLLLIVWWLLCPAAVLASQTQTWAVTGQTAQSTTASGVTTVTVNAPAQPSWIFGVFDAGWTLNSGSSTMDAPGSGVYAPDVLGDPALDVTFNSEALGDSQTITFSFSNPVTDPVLHIDRLGGNTELLGSNSAVWTLNVSASDAGPGATLERTAGVGHFIVDGGNRVYRQGDVAVLNRIAECTSSSSTGTACGSVRIKGTFTSLVFDVQMLVDVGVGDGMDLALSFDQDLSDAPASYGNPVHPIASGAGLRMGNTVGDDPLSVHDSAAAADDSDDGVTLPVSLPSSMPIEVAVSGAGGYLQAWIDWNGNGVFDPASETVAQDLQDSDGDGIIQLLVDDMPAAMLAEQTFMRFRWSSQAGLGPTAAANDGEVEDYLVSLSPMSCDLAVASTLQLGGSAQRDAASGQIILTPDAGTQAGTAWSELPISLLAPFSMEFSVYLGTKDANGADGIAFAFQRDPAGNTATGQTGNGLGVGGLSPAVAVEFDTYPNGSSFGDISNDHTVIYNPATPGSGSAAFYSNNVTDLGNIEDGAWHAVTLDWNPQTNQLSYTFDGVLIDVVTRDFVNEAFAGDPNVFFGFTSSTGGSSNLQKVCITNAPPQVQSDYGDAPASFGEPSHILGSGLRLGTNVDAELAGYDDDNAAADSFDDGVVFPAELSGGTSIEVSVAGAGGYLQAWIDWNQDGTFSDEERIANALQDEDLDGIISIDLNAFPGAAVSGDTFARFRWSSQQQLDAEEGAPDGEVEDYAVTLGPIPFQCDNTLYQIATNASLLRRIDFSGTSASFVDIGTGAGRQVNGGWGYNEQDGLIYALRSGSTELWRVDANGQFSQTAAVVPNDRRGSNAGDVLPDGRMIYKTSNNRLSVVDLTMSPPTYQGDIALSASANFIDMAYNPVDGNIYSLNNNNDRLFWIDLASGQLTYFGPALYSGSYGAHWFDEDGRFYAYENNTNNLYYIDVGINGDGSGNRVLLATSTTSVGGVNDGAFCRGEAPIPLGSLSGKIYQDLDQSDLYESGEPGLPAVEVSLYRDNGTPANVNDDVLVGSVESDSNGNYLFPAVLAGQTYRVEVNDADPDLPSGAVLGTANPLTGILIEDGVENSANNFGFDITNITLSGWVFEDNGVGATAHDGVKGELEPGLANVTLTLYQDSDADGVCAATDPVLATAQTTGDGAFSLLLGATETGNAVCLQAETPSGFISVSESGGSLPAATGSEGDDVQTLTLPAPGTGVTGLLFGDAGLPVLEPDQQGVIAAGGSRFYAHRFTARSAGMLDFVLASATTSPATPEWSDTLYRDDNCNGVPDGADASLPLTGVAVAAGEQYCLLVKVFAPADVSVGAQHVRSIAANQLYTGSAVQASAQVTDTTRIAAGELQLEKRVQNLSEGSAESTGNQAEPGDVLRYRLVFRNNGSSALAAVTINDATPVFTSLEAAVSCPPLPAGLTGCSIDTPDGANGNGYQGAIEWTFNGELQPGAEGEVSYQVRIDQ